MAEAAACPTSDFVRDAALLALAARTTEVSRESYHRAVDDGSLVVAHVVRGAIHALSPSDFALYGRALLATDDVELATQLGPQVQLLCAEQGLAAGAALAEVAAATAHALQGGRALGKNELHEELRGRVRSELLPWCRGCGSRHVAPMLWRYATVAAGVRLDSDRRYLLGDPPPTPLAADSLRRFLHFYAPATTTEFRNWAGIAPKHARRLWDEVAAELVETKIAKRRAWVLRADLPELESPAAAEGTRLLPPGDPFLQGPNRALLAPDATLRSRLFRPVASPGAVLRDGRLAGLWRARSKGRASEITVEAVASLARGELEVEAERVAALRGSRSVVLVVA